jgi:hypothetical protein
MEPATSHKKLEPGIYEGRPEPPESEKIAHPRLVRTMKSDMAEAIKNQNETIVSIAIAEEKKKSEARIELSTTNTSTETSSPAPRPHGRIVVVATILLIIVAFGLAYIFALPRLDGIQLPNISIPSFRAPRDASAPTTTNDPPAPLAPSLIPAQSEKHFNVTTQTREQIVAEIKMEINRETASGSIKNVFFEESGTSESTAISINRLLDFMKISAPGILERSLEKSFMTGFWGEEDMRSTPFVILKASDYDNGLAGMLEWEETLSRSFYTLFGMNPSVKIPTIKFSDIIVLGRDARFLDIPQGNTIAYSFANQNTIVIARSRTALEALIPLARTPTSR